MSAKAAGAFGTLAGESADPVLRALRVGPENLDLAPAPVRRPWMERTPEHFADRCLPLLMANQSGWVVTTRSEVRAVWDGTAGLDGVRVMVGPTEATADRGAPVMSHFGNGILTWSMPWLFRTSAGWNLIVRGPVNWPVEGAYPLEGIVETDWASATFTMNWMLTRPGFEVRFGSGDPVCMLVPERRGTLERFQPWAEDIRDHQALREEYEAWRDSRLTFNADLRVPGSDAARTRWQHDYFQGASPAAITAGHQRRRSLRPFRPRPAPLPGAGNRTAPAAPPWMPALEHLPLLRDWLAGIALRAVTLIDADEATWRLLLRHVQPVGEPPSLELLDAGGASTALSAGGRDLIVLAARGDLVPLLEHSLRAATYVVVSHPDAGRLTADLEELGSSLRYRVHSSDGGAVVMLSVTDPASRLPAGRGRQEHNIWVDNVGGPGGSLCGPGSSLEQTELLRVHLRAVLVRFDVRSLLDAPCGDANWMGRMELGDIDYLGLDLIPDLVDAARRANPDRRRRYAVHDLLTEPLPRADLILCRDLLVHLPFEEARAVLASAARSGSRYLLTTTFTGHTQNADIVHGDWRPLNLCLPPFNFPSPVDVLTEGCTEGGGLYADKSLGLWPIETLPI